MSAAIDTGAKAGVVFDAVDKKVVSAKDDDPKKPGKDELAGPGKAGKKNLVHVFLPMPMQQPTTVPINKASNELAGNELAGAAANAMPIIQEVAVETAANTNLAVENAETQNADEEGNTSAEVVVVPPPPSVTVMSIALSNNIPADKADGAPNDKDDNRSIVTVEQQPVPSSAQHVLAVPNEGKMDDNALANFKVLYVVTQLCGLTMIVLMGIWIGVHMGGLGSSDNPTLEFNWHPLLMTIGLIFLYGNSILVYRGFRSMRKKTLKFAHAAVHGGAFIFTVLALKTVFDSHNLASPPIPNMYSLHSWLGLSAVILFCLQYVAGYLAYMFPGVKDSLKVSYMPLHIYFGLFGFILAIASALMGLTEKAIFAKLYPALTNAGAIGNVCGVLFVIFGGLVVYLVTEPSYKRKPIPEDAVLLTGVNE